MPHVVGLSNGLSSIYCALMKVARVVDLELESKDEIVVVQLW